MKRLKTFSLSPDPPLIYLMDRMDDLGLHCVVDDLDFFLAPRISLESEPT
jgi:hypothetical protein